MQKTLNGVTFLELVITMMFIGLIVLTVNSVNLFTRNQLVNSDRRAKIQNEASLVLEHMSKYIVLAIGNATSNPAVKAYSDNKGIRIRIDGNLNNPNTANGKADASDTWIAYRHENISSTDSEVRFYPNAGDSESPQGKPIPIAHKVVISGGGFYGLEFSGDFVNNLLRNNIIGVKVTCRWEPNKAISVDNPEVTLRTQIRMPSVSVN